MKYLFVILVGMLSIDLPAQQKYDQYLLIVRSKAQLHTSQQKINTNIEHWTAWMTDLGKKGKIANGYRPTIYGITLSGSGKFQKSGPYISKGKVVSSFLIINAADIDEAKQIASKCPVFELNGNVEIRPIQNIAN
jgi:hypothetical protein